LKLTIKSQFSHLALDSMKFSGFRVQHNAARRWIFKKFEL
jgi:hypothetical protein